MKFHRKVSMDQRKLSLLLALLTLIMFAGYFYYVNYAVRELLINERFESRKQIINVNCDALEKLVFDGQLDIHYINILSQTVSDLDKMPGTYMELFDSNFQSISVRSPFFPGAGEAFNPLTYPALVEQMDQTMFGEMVVTMPEVGGRPEHELSIYYRWISLDKNSEKTLLLVLGIGEFSLVGKVSSLFLSGALSLLLMAAIYILATLWLLNKLEKEMG